MAKKSGRKNYFKIPASITKAVRALPGDIFVVGFTKAIAAQDQKSFSHLNLPNHEGEEAFTLPKKQMGRYSLKNIEGWEVVRKDLPMIQKTTSWESPNFGDASRFGTHMHTHTRDVHQREWNEPRNYQISARLLRSSDAGGGAKVYFFSINQPLSRKDKNLAADLLLMINLLQENCGGIGVSPSDATAADHLRMITLDWELFPAGSIAEAIERFTKGSRPVTGAKQGVVASRVKLLSGLKPVSYLKGTGGFGSYIGALYANDLVVFENVQYGNALYVLYDDWSAVSKRPRNELLKGTDDKFDRIPHRGGWEEAFTEILTNEKRKRSL